MRKLHVKLVLIILTSFFIATVIGGSGIVTALSGSDFKAGSIIDDSIFYDGATMTIGEIQAFLNAKVPVCDTWHAGSGSNQPPFTCLKDYRQDTAFKPAETGLCKGFTPGNRSAAEIIYYVGESCGISPKVLIVLLQKEQSLITDTWPWNIQYRSATGYGCPDTAPCDAEYYGFFNQVYAAARQFKRYALSPSSFNYRRNQNNYILYNPNAACGGSNVFIENSATAGLYNYTPYQPNASALANLYGTGDSCGAYGNRNFWRIYNDWFGTTLGSYMLRSVEDATVYLVSDGNKYPINNVDILNALYPLGLVKFVSQQYLNKKATGATMTRLVRAQDGTVYFFDAGIKLPFTSCGLIDHYGYTCGQSSLLTDLQLQKLVTGPHMSQLFGTTSGKVYYVNNDQKREAFDGQALSENGLSGSYNILNESALSNLSYGAPVMRPKTIAHSRSSNIYCLYDQAKCIDISSTFINQTTFQLLARKSLDESSIQKLPSGGTIKGLIKNSAQTAYYVLDGIGKAPISEPSIWSDNYTTLSDELLNAIPNSWQPVNNKLIKSRSNGTVYFIDSQKKRPISSWDDLLRLSNNAPVINELPDQSINTLADGLNIVGPGTLVKHPGNGTVYMIDGHNRKFVLTTFTVSSELGIPSSIRNLSQSVLDTYQTQGGALSTKYTCSSKNYIGTLGTSYEVDASVQSHYGFTYQELDSRTCSTLPISSKNLNRFIRVNNGTIYYVESGQKKAFTSYQTYLTYGGGSSNTVQVSDFFAASIPNGLNL